MDLLIEQVRELRKRLAEALATPEAPPFPGIPPSCPHHDGYVWCGPCIRTLMETVRNDERARSAAVVDRILREG